MDSLDLKVTEEKYKEVEKQNTLIRINKKYNRSLLFLLIIIIPNLSFYFQLIHFSFSIGNPNFSLS